MTIPTAFTELSTTAASNPPAGGDQASDSDNHLRQVYAFLASLYGTLTGGQIAFPATQNASSNANTLDDYEEGSWTPTDASGASLSFSASGRYIKVGKLVYVKAVVVYPTTSSGASAVLGGLPFTAANDAFGSALAIGYTSSADAVHALVVPNATTVGIYTLSGATTNVQLTGATVYLAGTYEATA